MNKETTKPDFETFGSPFVKAVLASLMFVLIVLLVTYRFQLKDPKKVR